MAITLIDVGTTANDGTGDPLRTAFQTVNTALTRLDNTVNIQTGYVLLKDDGGSAGVVVTTGGSVGIGTTSPSHQVDIYNAVAGYMAARVNNAASGADTGAELRVQSQSEYGIVHYNNSSGTHTVGNAYDLVIGNSWNNNSGRILFMTKLAGTPVEAVAIDGSGSVGVNETAPDYKLDVNGSFGFTPGASVTPVDNGDIVFEATSNTTFTVKLKGSDGVVRSGTITLA